VAFMNSLKLKIRQRLCDGCDCEVDKSDPCAVCPKNRWGASHPCEGGTTAPTPKRLILQPPGRGAGAELKKMLHKVGINPVGPCQCNARAAQMDAMGPDWCEENLETIVGWLREEAERRKLPFLAPAARMLVKLAIRKARKMQG